MAEVEWTNEAKANIEEIRRGEGDELVRAIMQAVHTISFHPWDGIVVPEVGLDYVREIKIDSHRVIYQILVLPTRIRILGVFHEADSFQNNDE